LDRIRACSFKCSGIRASTVDLVEVVVYVRDMERAIRFYRDTLGLQLEHESAEPLLARVVEVKRDFMLALLRFETGG
jgi:catechol 2,3-dioxygenase-like lactoylglutathione lyase family enzyme